MVSQVSRPIEQHDAVRESGGGSGLDELTDPALDSFFSSNTDAPHGAFLSWLIAQLRPAQLVAAGAGAAPFLRVCAGAVMRLPLPTACLSAAFEPDPKHAHFARALPGTAEAASAVVATGSVDLIILSAADDSARQLERLFEHWRPALSPTAVVLLPGVGPRRQADGVWRFWDRLRHEGPGFEFLHGQGLAALAPGLAPPDALLRLAAIGSTADGAARLRQRFSRLDGVATDGTGDGAPVPVDRSEHDRMRDRLAEANAGRQAERRQAARAAEEAAARLREAEAALAEARAETVAARGEAAAARDAAAAASRAALAASDRAAEERLRLVALLDGQRAGLDVLRSLAEHQASEVAALRGSSSWRLTAPLRRLLSRGGPQDTRTVPIDLETNAILAAAEVEPAAPDPVHEPEPAMPPPVVEQAPQAEPEARTGQRPIRRILFIAGESKTPGAIYRTQRNAAACAAAGYETRVVDAADVNPEILTFPDLAVLWRAPYSLHIDTMIRLMRHAGVRVAFDVDDLVFKPSLARTEIIDGIRTTATTESDVLAHFEQTQQTLKACDFCLVTTEELAAQARSSGTVLGMNMLVQVIPNIFDETVERASRNARRLRDARSADGLVRIGYAGGSRTHQKDFALVAPVLAHVLGARPQTRLVLFRDGRSGEGLVLLEEFPELLPFAAQVEWRDMVPLAELPAELARFDVSICPLEAGNPFVECKSELKYFESALAGVCVVASPTGPFRRAIRHGVTGLLAADAAEWAQALLAAVDDPALRTRLARDAYHHVLWQFGPQRQRQLWHQLVAGLQDGPDGARANELALRRGDYDSGGLPEIPDSTLLFATDALGEAQVTIGITSFNYASLVVEALESAFGQTLEMLDLVVVDDGSTDGSVERIGDWLAEHHPRFNRVRLLRTVENAGLGGARNLMFSEAETPFVMVLDADNRLPPACCAQLLEAMEEEQAAAFAYPTVRQFGGGSDEVRLGAFEPLRLAGGNYIDAMALVAKWAWAAAGGCYVRRDAMGWEDFDLWCRLAEIGQYGISVPDAVAEYRVHRASMTNSSTEQAERKRRIVDLVESRHPWLRLTARDARQRA